MGLRTLPVVLVLLLHAAAAEAQSLTFTIFAGPEGAGSDDGTGNAARFQFPKGIAVDDSGNLYVADQSNHTIRKITPDGKVTTLAGLGGSRGTAGGTGHTARFDLPSGAAVDGAGNVYVADALNHTIRKITPPGAVTTFAGLAGSSGATNGTGSAARFSFPDGVATDESGNVYVVENETIRKITAAGVVTTLAGLAGSRGSTDGTGSAARFRLPDGVATDASGNVYVADTGNHTIRKITPAGVVTTFAGGGVSGSADATGTAARFNSPHDLTVDGGGNVYVADSSNHTIRKITPAGVVTTLAGTAGARGTADGIGGAARFRNPEGIAADSSGNVYVADTSNNTIRKITQAGVVTTLAGLASTPEAPDGSGDGSGHAARFDAPAGVAIDAGGNVYVADSSNRTIRKITPDRAVTTFAGSIDANGSGDGTGSAARFSVPIGIAIDGSGNLFVADFGNHNIRRITPEAVVTTLAGAGAGSSDGMTSVASFRNPTGIAVDGSGNVYVADEGNHTIRKISGGNVTTIAGMAGSSGSTDGTGSEARFHFPQGLAVDSAGNVYVADTFNSTIRKITPAGVVTTLAGAVKNIGSMDGTGGEARFSFPNGLAIDVNGLLYVADSSNQTIRTITSAGVVRTLAGRAAISGRTDGTGSAARFDFPQGLAIGAAGTMYVADSQSHTIRIGRPALGDAATIDSSFGARGTTRLLQALPQTANSWQWSVIRRPADSTAALSSADVPSPTFTPDAAGLFTFRLVATGVQATSVTTVDLTIAEASARRRAVRK